MAKFQPEVAPNESNEGRRKFPRWAVLRLIQFTVMSAAFYMLLAVSVAPNERLALAIVETQSNATQNVFVNANDSIHWVVSEEQTQLLNAYKIRIGVWNICANNKLVEEWVCTAHRFNLNKKQETESKSLAEFLTLRILASTSKSLEGLGGTTATIPLAAAWIGVFGVGYFFFAFFSFWRPACWRPNTCRDTCLTHRVVALFNTSFCLFLVFLAWTFSWIIQMAANDALADMSVIKVSKVKQGEGGILLSVAACLQVVAITLQYMIYRESGFLQKEAAEADGDNIATVKDEPKAALPMSEKEKDAKTGERPASFEWKELPRYSYRTSLVADKKPLESDNRKSINSKRSSEISVKRLSSTEI